MQFNPTDRFEVTVNTPDFHPKCKQHNIERWIILRNIMSTIEVPLYLTQIIEIWQNHLAELDANRPDNYHHQHTIPNRPSLEIEVTYALNALIKAKAINKKD